MTSTTNSGSGTSISVMVARPFCDGYGYFQGDLIRVGSNQAKITNVNYTTNTITIDTSISWSAGDGVSYLYNGSRPDIGAYEY